jgi:GNAT superfamily N-acetyltransferase
VADDFTISDDKSRLDLDVIHGYLVRSYWSSGIPREVVARGIEHALCFGVYNGAAQVGFARVITDRATFAYLADVFVLEAFRGRGLSKQLMAFIMAHPELQGLRRFMLATRDAHGLYTQFGFNEVASPSRLMEIVRPDIYQQ